MRMIIGIISLIIIIIIDTISFIMDKKTKQSVGIFILSLVCCIIAIISLTLQMKQ